MNITCTRGEPYEYHQTTERGIVDLFSVSQIRKVAFDQYRGVDPFLLEQGRKRGSILHHRFWQALAKHVGLYSPILFTPPGMEGFCLSMDRWIGENVFDVERIEWTSSCLELGFAGTADAKLILRKKHRRTIVDLKTGAPSKTDAMQLLAYKKMKGYEDAQDLLDLYIQADGSYAVEKYVTPKEQITEWAWFETARNLLVCQRNHGVLS